MAKLKIMNNLTFNEFCNLYCDGLYDPHFPEVDQSTGYIKLKKMVAENIKPASLEETKRWEQHPTSEEFTAAPDIKYLRFLHSLLRPRIRRNWDIIKNLKL